MGKLFNEYNTDDYTVDEISELNDEWMDTVETLEISPDDEQYDIEAKKFSDMISKR